MTTRNLPFIVHPAAGGLDATTAATLMSPDQLVIADNVEYDVNGSRRKRLGTARYNASAASGTFTGLADFWRHGASLTPTQKFVGHVATTIVKDDGDGVWDTIKSSWGSDSLRTDICIAGGYAVFANGSNTPQKWDQTTMSDLSADANTFSFAVYHLRRLWVAGYAAAPSELDISAAGNITTWTGGDSGTITFDEDDGDRIMGISRPFRGRLYIFKGPQHGSIHEVAGTTLSDFTKKRLFSGAPCVAHQGIITTTNDIYWASPYGIHSLRATDKFGDTEEAFLSRPIQTLYRDLVESSRSNIAGFWHPTRNIVGWFVTPSGETSNKHCFVYNYARDRWAVWKFAAAAGGYFAGASCAVMLDPAGTTTRKPRLYIGGTDGFVREGDQTVQSDDNAATAYSFSLTTPNIAKFTNTTELEEKSFFSITTFYRPVGSGTVTLGYTVDGRAQSTSLTLTGSGDVLG